MQSTGYLRTGNEKSLPLFVLPRIAPRCVTEPLRQDPLAHLLVQPLPPHLPVIKRCNKPKISSCMRISTAENHELLESRESRTAGRKICEDLNSSMESNKTVEKCMIL